jgi:citrate lyase subunit beta/citryl-CoA lyase
MHPSQALFDGKIPTALAVCDHYCGTEPRMIKALALQKELGPCFDITFDCEDGAPVGEEKQHAQLVSKLINSSDNLFNRVGVRVHDPLSSYFQQDLEMIIPECGERLSSITIPKVESAQQVNLLIQQINSFAAEHGLTKSIPIHVLIETHQALDDVFAIAALPQVECLSFGLMDFISAHHGAIPASAMAEDQFKHPLVTRAMLEISAACHRYGKTPSHNVCTAIKHPDILRNDCLTAKNLFGYTRKWSIHPEQIPVIVATLNPQTHEISLARDILYNAQQANWGPIQFAGKLHDRASYRYYWMILQRARHSGINFPQLEQDEWLTNDAV